MGLDGMCSDLSSALSSALSLSSPHSELLQQGWLQPKPLGSCHSQALNTLGFQRGHQQSTWEKWLPAMREVNRQIREGRHCLWQKEKSSAFTEFSSSMKRQGCKYLPELGRLCAGAQGEVPK